MRLSLLFVHVARGIEKPSATAIPKPMTSKTATFIPASVSLSDCPTLNSEDLPPEMSEEQLAAVYAEVRNMSSKEKTKHNHENYRKFEHVAQMLKIYQDDISSVKKQVGQGADSIPDFMYYRILRGWKFSLPAAVKEAIALLEFRRENETDKRMRPRVTGTEFSSEQLAHIGIIHPCYPKNAFHFHDLSGQPVCVARIGRTNMARLLKTVTLEQLMESTLMELERLMFLQEEWAKECGRFVRGVRIIDMEGFGMHLLNRRGIKLLRACIKAGTSYYPESMGNVYVVRAPWAFSAAWKIIKPMLKESTIAKIKICGSDYLSVLEEAVGLDKVPKYLGGNCNCQDGCCPLAEPEKMEETTVGPRKTFDVEVEVASGQNIEWEFETKSHNIGFGVLWKPAKQVEGGAEGEEEVLRPVAAVESQAVRQRGSFSSDLRTVFIEGQEEQKEDAGLRTREQEEEGEKQPKDPEDAGEGAGGVGGSRAVAGRLVLRFDNSFSRFTSKTLMHRVATI